MKEIKVVLGYKYRIYPTHFQKQILNHQMFIYNQTYNICLNLFKQQYELNKELPKNERTYSKSTEIDTKVKSILASRELKFSTVVTQQARRNFEKAIKQKDKSFPKFKKSGSNFESFNWNNQGYSIKDTNNPKKKILRLLKQDIILKYHRTLPDNYKMNQITISQENGKYYVAFSITYFKKIKEVSIENLDKNKSVGIDLNVSNIALSSNQLIPTKSIEIAKTKYDKRIIKLKRKQSRRILISKKFKVKLGRNFKKTQLKINKILEKSKNKKNDKYHKLTNELVNQFDLIVTEDLSIKNMTKRAKNTKVKQKSSLNKHILNTSFYQLLSQLKYKTTHNGKLFIQVQPQFTSKTCRICGQINDNLKLSDRIFECKCGHVEHRDTNASHNIHNLGLKSIGLGINLADYNSKAFRLNSLEFIS